MDNELATASRGNDLRQERISEDLLFEVLSHKTRRQILKELARNIICSYSVLKAEIKVSTGVLYHHLQKLIEANLVFQRPDKEYELTPLGVRVVQFMDQNQGREIPLSVDSKFHGNKFSVMLQGLLEAIPFSSVIQAHGYHVLLEAVLVLVICINFQLQLGMWFFGPFLIPTFLTYPWFLLLEGLGIVIQVLFMELLPRIMFGRPENARELAIGNVALTSFPAMSIILLWFSHQASPEMPGFLYWPMILVLQLIYLLLGAQMLVKFKRLSWDRALLVSLGAQYLFMVAFQLLLSLASPHFVLTIVSMIASIANSYYKSP